jgi:hypothetical protein
MVPVWVMVARDTCGVGFFGVFSVTFDGWIRE